MREGRSKVVKKQLYKYHFSYYYNVPMYHVHLIKNRLISQRQECSIYVVSVKNLLIDGL